MLTKSQSLTLITSLLILVVGSSFSSYQDLNQWSPQQTIPGYHPETWPPILIADRNRTVHAFSSQWMDEDKGPTMRAIMYNQWTLEQGWTTPIDILLSPLKNDARLLDAFLDQSGIVHVIFWGGDNTEASIYYSSAPIADAGNAQVWSATILVAENAQDPENGVFYTDDHNNFVVLFSGKVEGNGLYTMRSKDHGETWSKPILLFITNDNENFINNLKIFKSDSGWIHSIWNEVNPGGQGRGIYYSKTRLDDLKWSDPVKLAEATTGYGTQTPAIIEYNGEIIAFYNVGGDIGIVMRHSIDGGENWSEPSKLFRRHVGVNGSLSPVVDENNELHLFFGQRIPGNPDIHGMWHSVWQGDFWSEPEAIVSGPGVGDQVGDKAFDPFETRAVESQGNVLLVTWRSDPGLNGNGVWYSFKVLDAPELPLVIPKTILPTTTVNSNPTTTLSRTAATLISNSVSLENIPNASTSLYLKNNPTNVLIVSIIPVFVLISLAFIITFIAYKNRN